jgi:predicted dehydrogenase
MANPVSIAVVGVGNMGSSHLKSIADIDNLNLAAICDIDVEKGEKLAKENDVPFFKDHKSLLEAKVAEAIVIATPHYDHTTIGIKALEAGLHVLVEKPISVHKADCKRLIAAYKNKDQVFSAMFNQRTNPMYIKAKELLENGELGEFRRVNWIITDWYRTQSYYNSGGWRATWAGEGGGVLLNQCPHQLDLIQWICGMPSSVKTIGGLGKFHEIEVEDDVTTIMEYPNGGTGVFVTTTGEAPGTNRLEIVGTRGKLVIESGHPMKFIRNEQPTDVHLKEATLGFGKPPIWNIEIPVRGGGEGHRGILKNFANAIQGKEELLAPAVEGIHSVELANGMIYSLITKETVEFPLDEKAYEETLKGLISNSTFVKAEAKAKTNADDFSQSH